MIIQKDGIQRAVELPVQLCVNTIEAKELVRALTVFLACDGPYGWVDISFSEDLTLGANVKPLDWREPA